ALPAFRHSGRGRMGRISGGSCADRAHQTRSVITPVARRRPWKLAREVVSLDQLSRGRVIFGVGLGTPPGAEFECFGEDPSDQVRARKLDEALAVLGDYGRVTLSATTATSSISI